MNITIRFNSFVAVSALLFSIQADAFDFGSIAKQVAEKVAVEKASDAVSDSLSGDGSDADAGSIIVSPEELASAEPVIHAPMPVTLEVDGGSAGLFSARPKIALAGYNIGAFQTASISGMTTRGQGASVNMDLTLSGIDASMLQRIADAAHADLVAQLQGAGIDVVDAPTLFKTAEADEIIRTSKTVKGKHMDGRASKTLIVSGPADIGVVSSFGLVPKGFNGNVGDQASAALDAIVIYPNVAFDFAWTSGGGRSMLQNKVSVDGGARFALDSTSKCFAVYSKDGRYVDGSVTLKPAEDLGVDDVFAVVSEGGTSNNSGAVGLSNALGFGMSSKKGVQYLVTADQKRYEDLAMNAVKGFNSAIVMQIKSAKGN